MKLWLDDVREPPEGWLWAETYKHAIQLLEAGKVEIIDFDHDLGSDKNGYDVACWIERRVHVDGIKPPKWRIHTANPVGAERIKLAMSNAEKAWKTHSLKSGGF